MEKRCLKRLASHDGHQSGCMQGLLNMFDFRHGYPSQKLLLDRKHGSRRVGGADAKIDTIVHDCQMCSDALADGLNGTPYTDDSQMSMRELMEEEMFQLNQRKGAIFREEEEQRQNRSAKHEAHGKSRRWRRSKMSFDLNDIKFTPEKPTHRKNKSLSSLDVNNMVAELCFEIHHPDVDCSNHDQGHEESLSELEEQSCPALEAKLQDATKVLVTHFIERKNFARGEMMLPSRDLLDALQLLKSNKDMFLKLLQDPDSQLVKQLHSLQCHQDTNNQKTIHQQEKQNRKYPNFFWRKFRGLEKYSSKKGECAQVSKIVVLKPGPRASKDTVNRGQAQKGSSHFSLFELTRRLKRSMGKELPDAGRNIEKSMRRESLGVTSPSSGYLLIERIPKASMGLKRLVGGRSKEIGLTSEQRISKFYSEARKHLAESLAGDDLHVDILRKQATKPLGRILSYGDYSSSPLCSPRMDSHLKLLTLPIISASKDSNAGNEVAPHKLPEQTYSDLPTLVNQERGCELLGNAHDLANDVIIPRLEDSGGEGQNVGDYGPSISAVDSTSNVQDGKEMITSADFPTERSLSLNTAHKSCSTSLNNNEHGDGICNEGAAKGQPLNLKLDSESLSSPLSSPTFSLKSEDVEGQYDFTDKAEHPSPVSVLDQIYDEDNISPSKARLSTDSDQLLQPRKINFEVQTISSEPCFVMWAEEKHSIFELVNVVMQTSGLAWDELLEKFCFSYNLLESSFFDEFQFIPELLYYDPQLLFDLIIEVLHEICRHEFEGILSRVRPHTVSKFRGKDMVTITWEGVAWHLQLEGLHHTLDQIIARDYTKSGTWVEDLRLDTENVGLAIEEAIMEDLVGDTMLNCLGWDLERICSFTC